MTSPLASMSIRSAAGERPRPGIVGIEPHTGYTNPAPMLARTSSTGRVQPVGAPSRLGSDEIDR